MTVYHFIFIIFYLLIQIFFIKNKFLLEKVDFSTHKKFINKNQIPVTGGLLFLIYFVLFIKGYNYVEMLIYFFIFLIGFISDFRKNFTPILRLILQIILCILFIWLSGTSITNINIDFFNQFLIDYNSLSILLTTFSIIVLVNGSNFIDGVNLSAIGYYLGLFVLFYFLGNEPSISNNQIFLKNIIIILSFILLINIFNMTMLGDGGIYLISFITGFFVIGLVDQNRIFSPYFAVLIFWYPCIENLFSIIRKKLIKIKTAQADNLHLHHLIYFVFKKKFKNKYVNNITGLSLLLFNYLIFYLSFIFYSNTKILIVIFLACVALYVLLYSYFYKLTKQLI